jgi:hypothetical protein
MEAMSTIGEDIEISSSTPSGDGYHAKNTADPGHQRWFHSRNSPNQWLMYDFKTRRVNLTHYSVAAHNMYPRFVLRSWVIEGSMDGEGDNWVAIDARLDDTTADSSHQTVTFAVTHSESYRFIGLRQTGKNGAGSDYLIMAGFEMFGSLIE